jgi:hypothetical protein
VEPVIGDKCPICGEPALPGRITCGKEACHQADGHRRRVPGMVQYVTVEEVLADVRKHRMENPHLWCRCRHDDLAHNTKDGKCIACGCVKFQPGVN